MDEGSDSRFTNIFKKIFGSNGQQLEEHILEAKADGEIESDEVSMLLNVLDLDEKIVSEIMVPRTDMDCAEETATIQDVVEVIINQGTHSRIPVYRNNRDHILGVVHAKDLLQPLLKGQTDLPITDLMRPALFISEESKLDEILSFFKREKQHMAVVQDKFGGTSGIVTMDDILEEIVGEIADEYDEDRPDEIKALGDDIFIVSGRVPLDEVCEMCKLDLESPDVDSIGGYVAAMAGRIPRQNEFFTFDGKRFTVLEADERQIWSIRVEPLEGA